MEGPIGGCRRLGEAVRPLLLRPPCRPAAWCTRARKGFWKGRRQRDHLAVSRPAMPYVFSGRSSLDPARKPINFLDRVQRVSPKSLKTAAERTVSYLFFGEYPWALKFCRWLPNC